jgi:hypothetical protein
MRPSGSAQAVWHSRGEGPESASTSTRSQALEEVIQLKNEEKKKNMQKIKHSRKRGRRTHIKQGGRYTESDNVAMQHRRTQIKSVRITIKPQAHRHPKSTTTKSNLFAQAKQ